VPEQIWVGEAAHRISGFTLRWLTRYRSQVYRDLSNSIELPGAWIHDASVDFKFRNFASSELRASFSLRNVFNLMSVEISAPATHDSHGRTAYSDMAGAPLPGRQWLLNLELGV
jgi:outer membrane receptor protein involved in Fe transport